MFPGGVRGGYRTVWNAPSILIVWAWGGVSTCGASCNRVVGCKVISGGFLHLNLGLGFLI